MPCIFIIIIIKLMTTSITSKGMNKEMNMVFAVMDLQQTDS